MNKDHKFIIEGIFLNGIRCDIIDLTDGVIYEILNSEDDKKFNEKVKRYPKELRIIKILT